MYVSVNMAGTKCCCTHPFPNMLRLNTQFTRKSTDLPQTRKLFQYSTMHNISPARKRTACFEPATATGHRSERNPTNSGLLLCNNTACTVPVRVS